MSIRIIIILGLFIGPFLGFGQDIQYVTAENGLMVREKPSRGASKLDMLDYGTAVEVVEHTNLMLDIADGGNKISGEWVKIRGIDAYEFFEEGYVFNGFLTEEILEKRFKVQYDEFTVFIDGVTEKESKNTIEEFNNIMFYDLANNEAILNNNIRVKHHRDYRSIEVFQKYENSIAISDDSSHCDIINWQHYYSSWKPLARISKNVRFRTLNITEKESHKFIDADIEEFKAVVNKNCGESWGEAVKNINSFNEAPANVALSKVFFRIVMIDIDGMKTEKIIIFDIPVNCDTKTDAYAKL